ACVVLFRPRGPLMSPQPGRLAVFPAVACLLAISACDGAVVHPVDVGAGCPEQPLRSADAEAAEAPDGLLADFEDGDSAVDKVGGRDGTWVETNDNTTMDVGWENSPRCAVRGQRSGHFHGSGLTAWGANLTGVLKRSTATPIMIMATPYD